jgi:hypothetical protein
MPFQDGRKYAAECISAELTQSPTKGTPGIELGFRTDEGNTHHTLWLTDKTREQLHRALRALGILDPESFNPLHGDLSLLVGATCSLKMGAEQYGGETTIRVQWINPPRVPVARERVAAYFGKRHQTSPVPAEVSDDDVPF